MALPTGILFDDPQAKPLSTSGQFQPGCYLLFFLTGTTTPTNVYADGALTTPLTQIPNSAQPSCTADGFGRFNPIYMNPAIVYRVQLFTAAGIKLEDVDPYVVPLSIGGLTANLIGTLFYPETASESTAGATPTNFQYQPGDSRRYPFDLTGATNNTALLQAVINAAGLSAIATGQINEVTLWPGTYLITRVYINYSNVYLKLMPGSIVKQTLTGIVNNQTTGQTPAYAAIHCNPLTYTNNPSSAITAISNVRIYGGGTVQGPFTTNPGSYMPFVQGIASQDCNSFWVTGITMAGFGGENIASNSSAWNTCTNLKLNDNEVLQGGAFGFNNCRASEVMHNYVHDSWVQNGIGADGDNILVGFNRIRNMAGGAMTPGGSGARDIGFSRDVTYIGNISTATGLSITNTFGFFGSDDGATTIPKLNHKYIGNTIDAHNGPIGMAFDYNTASNIDIQNNIVTNTVSPSGSGADFNVIAGSGVYRLYGNTINTGTTGNNVIGLTISSAGTPTIYIEEGNDISGHSTDINWSLPIVLNGQFVINSLILVLTGFAVTQNVPIFVVKKGGIATINFSGAAATSNSTTMTLGTLPVYLRPTRSQNFRFPVIDNGVNMDGILQIASTGVMTFFKDINGTTFTAAGTKGLPGPYDITYILT